jgi:cold shock CspA family protein
MEKAMATDTDTEHNLDLPPPQDQQREFHQRTSYEITAPVMHGRMSGKVKFFNSHKGFGFIVPDNAEWEVFVHHTAIRNSGGFRSLAEGEFVEFDVLEGKKGMQAANVTGPNGESVIGDPEASHLSNIASAAASGGRRSSQASQVPVSHMHFPYPTMTSSNPISPMYKQQPLNFYQPQPYGYYPAYYPIAAESTPPTNSSGQASPEFPNYSTLYNPYSAPIAYYPGSYVKGRPYYGYPVAEEPNNQVQQHEENIHSTNV